MKYKWFIEGEQNGWLAESEELFDSIEDAGENAEVFIEEKLSKLQETETLRIEIETQHDEMFEEETK